MATLGEDFTGTTFPCPEAGAYIILTFDGEPEEVDLHIEKARKLALENGAMEFIVLDDPEESARIWKMRGGSCESGGSRFRAGTGGSGRSDQ